MSTIQLGPFDLLKPIGQGGMAEVWRGHHRGQNIAVAAKIITAHRGALKDYTAAFRNEVQAVAALDHPNIVLVFDHGELSQASAQASGGRLAPGSPYLVMELASGGSLDLLEKPLPWRLLKPILLVLLDALAHAHARGVIHRDLKPANVLLCGPLDTRPGLKLTDFGIAHASTHQTRRGNLEVSMGTPYYMAPEQFEGAWRDYGPWTDLYALGCMAYELAVGRVPFEGDNVVRLAFQHLRQQPAPILRDDLPEDFQRWVRRLMAKEPDDRFRMAADAAWALAQLPDPDGAEGNPLDELVIDGMSVSMAQPVVSFRDTRIVLGATGADMPWTTGGGEHAPGQPPHEPPHLLDPIHSPLDSGGLLLPVIPRLHSEEDLGPRELPPLPPTWQRPEPPGPSMQLIGAGLGLYGLRTIPLVDREGERNAIWDALTATREDAAPHLILLHGAAGTGKSRVVEWVAQRAHEVGGALILQANHSPDAGAADGLPRMIARHLRCVGLTRAETLERCEATLKRLGFTDTYDWNALTELILPASEREILDGAKRIRFGAEGERYALIQRILAAIARERPLICWIDDVQWGQDALSFVQHVLSAPHHQPLPLLFLLTVRDEALAVQPDVEAQLGDLMDLPASQQLALGPLAPGDRTALVQELLGLEGDLARQVEERTGGNPLFAVQLVGDWVTRGVLEVGERGFVLRHGERAHLPDDLYAVWNARADRLFENQPASAAPALELAALLGREVNPTEWEAACAEAGVAIPPNLLSTLFAQRLALRTVGGWTFAHGILRETLERRAREAGRWEQHHHTCAEMLRVEHPPDLRGLAERIGRHSIEAGDLIEGLDLLLQGARERREASEYREALDLLTLRDTTLTRCGIPPSDPRWGQGWTLRSWVGSNQGRVLDAWTWAERAERAARQHRWLRILPQALLGMGVAARDRGDLALAWSLTQEALSLYEHLTDRIGVAHGLQNLGVIARHRGRLASAHSLITRALHLHHVVDNAFGVAQCQQRLTEVVLRQDNLHKAERVAVDALNASRDLNDRLGEAWCLLNMGDILRFQGDLDAATRHYHASIDLFERLGSSNALYPRRNLAFVLLHHREYDKIHDLLTPIERRFEAIQRAGDARFVRIALLPSAAQAPDTQPWDRIADDIAALTRPGQLVDHDLAECAEHAGFLALERHWHQRARAALDLACHMWRQLRQAERVQRLMTLLHAFAPSP